MDNGESKASQKARVCVYRLLKLRARSEEEIRAKLKQKKFTTDVIEETLDHFRASELLDDRKFTRSWIASRLSRPFGFQRIRYELIQKGVDAQIIKEELDKATTDQGEEKLVLDLAQRRMGQYRRLDPLKAKQRLRGFLSRRGFSQEAIRQALNRL